MKKFYVFLVFLLSVVTTSGQEQHIYSSKENIFNNWIKRSGETAYQWGSDAHRVGALLQTYWYEIRNFNCWQWSYNDIPTEASVTSVTIKFRAKKGNYDDTFKFSLHSIPFVLNTPDINFFDQSNSNQIYLSAEIVPDDNKYIYFNQTFTEQTPIGQGREVWNAVNNAVQSGNYFLTLGIRERESLLLPYWFISSYDGSGTTYNPAVELIINFTTPNNYYSFINLIQQTEDYDSLILNNDIQNPIPSGGPPVFLPWLSQNTIRTDVVPFSVNWQNTESTQKHNYWFLQSESNVYQLNYNFEVNASTPSVQKAIFNNTEPAVIKNTLEGTSVTGGNIYFRDPWYYYKGENNNWFQSDAFKEYASPFSIENHTTDSYGGIFLNQEISSGTYYNVWAGNQQINLGSPLGVRQFYLQNWSATGANLQEFTPNHQRVVFTSPNAVVQANYKGQGLSNNQNAYANNSQRKFVRTNDGVLYNLYESLNCVWLERSTDGGTSWSLLNNANPLGSSEAISPSMDYFPHQYGDLIVIAYQQKTGANWQYRYAVYNPSTNTFRYGNVEWDTNPEPPLESIPNDAYMVVSWNGNGNALFVLKIGNNIHHTMCSLTATATTWIEASKGSFDGSNISSLSISSIKADVGSQPQHFYLAYQKSNTAIGYRNLYYSSHQGFNVTGEVNISTGNGFSNNYQPTIIESNGTVQVCWIGYREGVELDGGELPAGTTKVFYRSRINGIWSVFSSYGNNINSVNLNRNSNNSFAFAWSEGSSNINKFVKSNDITTVYNTNTTGRYVQVGNYPHLDLMRLNSFTTSTQPYYFTLSNTFDTVPEAEETEREGLIVQDTTAFYYSLGSIAVDDQTIEFIEVPDSVNLSSQEELNSYLISDPFNLTEASSFTYGVKFGVTDSLSAAAALSDGRFVQFKVELIEDQTGDVLGTFDNVTFNSENIIPYESNAYQVNLQGIGNRTCRLRLVTTDDIEFNYSLVSSYNNESALAKKGFTEVKLNGTETITEYALEQNYPNPFNPSTTIRYQIPNDGFVTLKVYDILGSEVATLVNEQKTIGRYEVNFNATNLASGVYIYKLSAGSYINSKKMLLIK